MSWTEERVDKLKKLWGNGFTAQQIAGELGDGVTRNAGIGKANRLKLSKSAASTETENSAKRKVVAPAEKLYVEELVDAVKEVASPAIAETIVVPPAKEVNSKDLVEPAPLNLHLLQLTDSTCKWPVSGDGSGEYSFCGAETNSGPYCKYHAEKAFHVSRNRRKTA